MEGVSIDDALGERMRLTHGLVIVLRASRLLASLGAFFFALASAGNVQGVVARAERPRRVVNVCAEASKRPPVQTFAATPEKDPISDFLLGQFSDWAACKA